MVKQEIHYTHQPSRIRSAVIELMLKRIREPRSVFWFVVSLLLFAFGLWAFAFWAWITIAATTPFILLFIVHYVVTSPRNFCGLEVAMTVQDDGLFFSTPLRNGLVYWGGFKEIYLLNKMWAVFVKKSEAVTFIPHQPTHPLYVRVYADQLAGE